MELQTKFSFHFASFSFLFLFPFFYLFFSRLQIIDDVLPLLMSVRLSDPDIILRVVSKYHKFIFSKYLLKVTFILHIAKQLKVLSCFYPI